MVSSRNSNKEVFEAEVLESSVIDEGVLKKILLRAGRVIAQPALEGFELIMDNSTPPQVRLSIMGALTYLIVPVDLRVRIKLSQTRSKLASPRKTEIIRTATTPIPAASVIPEIPP